MRLQHKVLHPLIILLAASWMIPALLPSKAPTIASHVPLTSSSDLSAVQTASIPTEQPTESPTETAIAVGQPAPAFVLPGLDGKLYRLEDYRGKRVILNFWASWCVPCREEMPLLDAAYKRLAQSGMVVIAVNQREDASTARQYAERLSLSFPIVLDSDLTASLAYEAFALPMTYFIDAEGIIRGRNLGALTADSLQQYLDLLTESPTPQATQSTS